VTDTLRIAARLAPELVALRRHLHGIPELGLDLPDTQAAVLEALAGLDLEVTLGESLSSVVAVLRGRAPVTGERPVVLLRGDMDALPVAEEVDVDYVSTRPGMMHACGHDLHMAGLVGAARILHELRDELVGDVVLMFQPAEEGPGGAEPMIREGLLEAAGRRVDVAYAVHVYSADHPFGTWFGRPGTLMAAADEVHVVVRGVGGHGSAPDRAKDPVPVACEIVLAYQSAVTRQFSVWDPVVLTVGRIAAGTKDNIIPDDAFVDATLRTFSAENRVPRP
jgi:amidohydrolase